MRQLVNIKKVAVDSDKKVAVQVEFLATDRVSKDNVFSLIEMQGEVAEICVEPAQQSMQFDKSNGDREVDLVGA